MRNFWIFPAVSAGILSACFFSSPRYLMIGAWILALIRILFLKRNKVLKTVIVFSILMGTYFAFVLHQQMASHLIGSADSGVIFPDEIKINGDQLSGVIKLPDQKARFNYQLKSQTEKKSWDDLRSPVLIEFKASRQQGIPGPRNPGEFDFKQYENHQNIFQSFTIDRIDRSMQYIPNSFFDSIHLYRVNFLNYLSQLPHWMKIQAQGLLAGYSGPDSRNLFDVLSVLGVIHLFSLSGLHIFLLIFIIQKTCSFLRINKELVDWTLLLILPIFGIFVGLKTGIMRAIVLAMMLIVVDKFKIDLSRLDLFGITILICLLLDPFALIEMGGQLSFVLSGALLYLNEQGYLMTSLKMNLLSLPIICFYTFQFSIWIWLMNIIFVPIFTYLILPSAILSAIFPNSLRGCWIQLNNFFELLYSSMSKLSDSKFSTIVVGQIPILITVALVLLGLLQLNRKRIVNIYFKYYLALFFLGIIYLKFPIFGMVSIIDVGQGDSILVTTPFVRKSILIDTGGKLKFPSPDWKKHDSKNQVELSTIPYLKSRGISKLDQVFLSHKDVDHIGNLDTLLTKFPVGQVNFGIGLDQNQRIKSIIHNHPDVKFSSHRRGENFFVGGSKWQVLWPDHKAMGENGDSLTLLADLGGKKWLFTGDLDIENEHKILSLQHFHVDFLKAGHHGSKTATSDELLKITDPSLALISAGVNNRYGHPNKETIDRLDHHHVPHLNTAGYGMISWYYFPISQISGVRTYLRVK
jgi:competence protein ComEC